MKITNFSTLIVSKDAENIIDLFEDLGFEKRHENNPAETIVNTTMKDAAGHQVDVAKVNSPQDRTLIRMNVDDFEEAFEFLKSKGFTNPSGRVIETETSKSAMLVSPSGFAFDLCQHLK